MDSPFNDDSCTSSLEGFCFQPSLALILRLPVIKAIGFTLLMFFLYPFITMLLRLESVQAQSVQTGHYAPGWNGTLKAGVMAINPGIYMQNTTVFFNAGSFKDGSENTINDDETDYVLNALAMVWRPNVTLLGADVQLVATLAVGNLSGLPVLVNSDPQDAPVGFTDIFFSPLSLGYHWSEFRLITAIGGFAPNGTFKSGETDNTGLGFWTLMPFTLVTYRTEMGIFKKYPLLATGGLFYEIHSNQQGRDFRAGDRFTFEWSLGLELTDRTTGR